MVFIVFMVELLLVVVGFALQDGEGTIELFDENQAHHLVAEGHG